MPGRHELRLRPGRFFFAERLTDLERLYEETHVLAMHYHWPETDILALPRSKRQRYLALIARQHPAQED